MKTLGLLRLKSIVVICDLKLKLNLHLSLEPTSFSHQKKVADDQTHGFVPSQEMVREQC